MLASCGVSTVPPWQSQMVQGPALNCKTGQAVFNPVAADLCPAEVPLAGPKRTQRTRQWQDCKGLILKQGCLSKGWAAVQEKVLAQIEEMHKKNPPKAKAAKPLKKEVPLAAKAEAGEPAEDEDEEEEEEDPVEAALNKYGIITENPWEKGVK